MDALAQEFQNQGAVEARSADEQKEEREQRDREPPRAHGYFLPTILAESFQACLRTTCSESAAGDRLRINPGETRE